VSMAYAIWSGVGTALVAAFGIWWFHETLNMVKVVSIGLIIAGVMGLNLSGGVH
jgi:small multidrug resistance pump